MKFVPLSLQEIYISASLKPFHWTLAFESPKGMSMLSLQVGPLILSVGGPWSPPSFEGMEGYYEGEGLYGVMKGEDKK